MKAKSATFLVVTTILRAIAVGALMFSKPTLPARAVTASDDSIRLGDESMSSEGTYQFYFVAKAGQTYPIGVSVDLIHWSVLTNAAGPSGQLRVADPEAPKFRQRFYQILPAYFTNMVFIPPGRFTMGTPASEVGHLSKEDPQTEVTLSRGFWMGKFEVSQDDYVAVTGTNNSFFTQNTKLPADGLSWFMATNFCYMLTQRERGAGGVPAGYIYRLPTEAEWEYACRAGTTTPFGIGDGTSLGATQANFDGTFPYGAAVSGQYLNRTILPGSYMPNAWGLYDMHGNVWEWCQDWYGAHAGGKITDPKGPATGSERVLRGGGYTSVGKGCRSGERDSRWPGHLSTINGFRVVLAPTL